eukprot:TRINITY_DN16034_c0_g1_i2.p1 TRINITY_DN16034_c0_g1~~TRINITY_DN16034_c0_g1_i2.p1  ORF type:complete len:196 (+),score=23.14 TRINITY_DN16034_c0_g1_i2:269-856(+)
MEEETCDGYMRQEVCSAEVGCGWKRCLRSCNSDDLCQPTEEPVLTSPGVCVPLLPPEIPGGLWRCGADPAGYLPCPGGTYPSCTVGLHPVDDIVSQQAGRGTGELGWGVVGGMPLVVITLVLMVVLCACCLYRCWRAAVSHQFEIEDVNDLNDRGGGLKATEWELVDDTDSDEEEVAVDVIPVGRSASVRLQRFH